MQNMVANTKKLEDIFKDNMLLKVPIFQRDYSWTKNNWKELLDDIVRGKKENINHYMGSVVLVQNKNYIEIIDGQQRITTINILLLALINNFNKLIEAGIDSKGNKERVEIISELIFSKNGLRNLSKQNRLELNEKNNIIYSEYISKCNVPENIKDNEYSNKLLIECFKYFTNKIEETCINVTNDDSEQIENLIDLYEYICEKLIFVEIKATDYGNAYVIFETLNDRGLDLAVTDLLKNYLFSKVSKSKHRKVIKYWDNITNDIGEKNICKFIRHHWNSYNSTITEKELFKALKKEINTENDCMEYLKDLSECSQIYKEFDNCEAKIWNNDDQIKKYVKQMSLYNVDLCYPVLLATMRNIKNDNIKRKLFKLCSIISFRYIIISKGQVNDLESFYNKLCKKIVVEKDNLKVEDLQLDYKVFLVSKEVFVSKFIDKKITSKRNKKLIMSILEEYEKNKGYNIIKNSTIEHILPENYTDEWDEIFENEGKEYRYKLGNYCLLEKSINNEIGNQNFEYKKQKYSASNYSIKQESEKINRWDKESLYKRQKKMAEIIESIYRF